MRRVRIVVLLVAAGAVVAPPAFAEPVSTAPPTPAVWTNVSTPPMSGDTSQKVYTDAAVVPGGGVFATGYTRHNLPGTSEVRTLVERWNGGGWTSMDTPDVETAPAADYMYGVSGTSASDVWVVGRSASGPGRPQSMPFAMHYDGTSWSKVAVPDPSGGAGADMEGVVAISPTNVWAIGTAYPLEARGAAYHWNGSAWSSVRLPLMPGCKPTNYTELTDITATPNGDVYAGGDCPTQSGYAGFIAKMVSLSKWQVVARIPGRSGIADLTSDANGTVWATGTQNTDTASRPFLLHGSGTTWNKKFRPVTKDGTTEQASGVAVTPTGITIVGEVDNRGQRAPFAATWNGTRWLPISITAPASTTWMSAIAGTAGGPVWAMGQYLGPSANIVGFASSPS